MKSRYPWVEKESIPCCRPETILEIKNLSLRYKNDYAFRDVNLQISKGCITGIVGPSGCGKSSLIQAINLIHSYNQECHLEGSIIFEGKDIVCTKINKQLIHKKIGMVFQNPNPFPLSIYKNLEIPLKEHDFDKIEERIEKALKDVGLWDEVKDRLDGPAMKLSGGQKQRLCIARSIVIEPEVILMDEPCSSLDPISSKVVEDLIEKMRGRYTVIIVTHNLAQARRIADKVAVFWFEHDVGKLIEFNDTFEIFERPKTQITEEYISGFRG